MDPATMVAEGLIAMRAQDGTAYNVAFAGLQFLISGGSVSLFMAEADGDVVSGTHLFSDGPIPLGAGYRKIRLMARIETVGADVQVTAFLDGSQIGTPILVGQDWPVPLGDKESNGEVYFVLLPYDDGTVPVGSETLSGPFSKIEIGYYAVGSIDSLQFPHKEGTVIPPNFDWSGIEDERFFPCLLPALRGVGLPHGVGMMPDPDPDDDEEDAPGMLPSLFGGSEKPSGPGTAPGDNDWSAAIKLPMLKVRMSISQGTLWRFNIVLPKLTALAYGGNIAVATLPMLKVGMHITIPNNMRFNVVLPMMHSVDDFNPDTEDFIWRGSVGLVWRFDITLPVLTTAGRIGGYRWAITLPALTGGGVGGSIGGFLGSNSLRFNIRLPRLKASAAFTTRKAGYRFYVVLPALAAVHGLAGAILLPRLRASARFSAPRLPGVVEARGGWAMNLQNNAVTEFEGFEFRAMGFAYNQHYGIGMDGGLYRMGGDNDAGQPIKWAWESGLADFGVNAMKGLMALYVDGLFGNSAVFSIQADAARRTYGHRARGDVYNHQPHRIPLGKGVRTRNIAIGMADEDGGYLELDKITPEYIVTTRNV
jgi:hypothetical protein